MGVLLQVHPVEDKRGIAVRFEEVGEPLVEVGELAFELFQGSQHLKDVHDLASAHS